MHKFIEALPAQGMRKTADGYLVGDVLCARTGIQVYAGEEVGKPDQEWVRIYRSADEVFKASSMSTFAGKPICDGHPSEVVTAENWKKYSRGQIGEQIARDGDAIRVSIAIMDAALISEVEAGKRELSPGYQSEIDWTPGVTEDGQEYDAAFKNIFVDHLAVVPLARGGPDMRIALGDSWGAAPFQDGQNRPNRRAQMETETIVVGDKHVEVSKATAQNLRDYLKSVDDADSSMAEKIKSKEQELEDMKKKMDEMSGENTAMKKKVEDSAVTPERLNELVAARKSVMDAAEAAGLETEKLQTMTDAEIRKEVVTARLGDSAAKMSDGEIAGAFKAIATTVGDGDSADSFVSHLKDGKRSNSPDVQHIGDHVFAAVGVKIKKA